MARLTGEPRLQHALDLKGQLTTAQIVDRLKALHEELTNYQNRLDASSLEGTKTELISNKVLHHKDKTVKAYTACCLADVLRLTAPDAPYTEKELSDMFYFFFTQLRNLVKPGEPQFQQYVYVMTSLADARSICIVCSLNNAESLMNTIFETLFDSLTPQTGKTVEVLVADLLIQLIEEMDTVPTDVTERILAQFIPKNAKARPYTLQVAAAVCNATKDKLQRYVSQYFTDILGRSNSDLYMDEDGIASDKEDDLDQIKSAHALIKEVNKNTPGLLLNVIPQLEAELRVDNEALRTLATKTTWTGRSTDKSLSVRLACLHCLKNIWQHHPVHSEGIQNLLEAKLSDPEDKVRSAACHVFEQLDFETALHHLNIDLLQSLAGRLKDKKPAVAIAALTALACLYKSAYSALERGDQDVVDKFGKLPGYIIESFNIRDAELLSHAYYVTATFLLPLPQSGEDDAGWVDRFVLTYSLLEPQERRRLLQLTNISKRQSIYSSFIEACEKFNGGVMDHNEDQTTLQLKNIARNVTATFPDPVKAAEYLMKFAKQNDTRLYKLLKTVMNPQADLEIMIKAHTEFMRKIDATGAGVADTMTLFLRRCGLLLLCHSAIPPLLRRMQQPISSPQDENAVLIAIELLTYIGEGQPVMFAHHVELLIEGIDEDENTTYSDMCLVALSLLAKADPQYTQDNELLRQRACHFIEHGTSPQAKAAATILALDPGAAPDTDLLIASLADGLAAADGARLIVSLNALSAFAKHASSAFEPHSESVSTFVLQRILLQADPEEVEMDVDVDWAEDGQMTTHAQACIAGLKLLTNLSLSYSVAEEALTASAPFFALLWQLLDSGGDVQGVRRSPPVAARLRSQASISLLRLATQKVHEPTVLRKFDALAWTIQDPVFQVRNIFLHKVTTYLMRQRLLNPAMNVILFLVAHDPESENQDMAKASIVNRARHMPQELRLRNFEHIFLRLLHIVAHHPDFTSDPDDLVAASKYIVFFLNCIASADNVSYLYHLANVLKGVRDADSTFHSDNLYIISELAAYLVKRLAGEKKWHLSTYGGKIVVPQGLFKPLPSPEVGQQILRKQYMSKGVIGALEQDVKTAKAAIVVKKQKAKKVKEEASLHASRAAADPKPKSKKRKSVSEPKTKMRAPAKKSAKKPKQKEWNSDASSAQDDADDVATGDTSEEEIKPKGSRSRPKARSAAHGTAANGNAEYSNDEVITMLNGSRSTPKSGASPTTKSSGSKQKKASPTRRSVKKRKSDDSDEDVMSEA